MEKQQETPKSPEQILAEKKEKLKNAVELMLDWQTSKRIREALFSHLDNLTSEEIEYCLMLVRYSDNQVYLRVPSFADTASKLLVEDEAELKEMEKNIGIERVKELINLIKGK